MSSTANTATIDGVPLSPPARLKRSCRSLYEALPLALAWCRRGRPRHVFRFDGGIGDEFLCTAVTRELKRRHRGSIWMLTDYPELFRHNPDVALTARKNCRGVRRFLETFGISTHKLAYAPHVNGRDVQPQRHVITSLCQSLDLDGIVTKRPYLFLRPDEIAAGRIAPRQIAVQSSGLAAKYAALTKEWYPDRLQKVVNHFRSAYTFVQVGSGRDPLLDGVVDMRGRTSIRQTAAILHQSIVFLGLAGFLQHLARSVECRSVIIYGGRELPTQTGYTCNENVTHQPACSPCWIYERCEHDIMCMDAVTTDMVTTATERQIDRYGSPLPEDTECL
ncbi:MAG TPA: hypothetical protein VHE61_02910 [Opitutaceae bacterium]|nr:hypothetical protein [Opitutaceae bacterium]